MRSGAEDDDTEMTHSVAINLYPATLNMPQLTIVVIDTIPVELKRSYMVWNWFVYVLAANLLLVIPLLWVAAWWSLRPIESLAKEVRELEEHHREKLNPETTRELTSLVRNLNRLLKSERERYDKYRTHAHRPYAQPENPAGRDAEYPAFHAQFENERG